MYILGSAEVHRVPQRAAHYTGDSLSVNSFLMFFFNSPKSPSGGALREAPGGRKEPLFPREYAIFCRISRSGARTPYKASLSRIPRGRAVFLTDTRRFSVAARPPVFELLTARQFCESSKLVAPEFSRIQSVPKIVFQVRQRCERPLVVPGGSPDSK